MGIFDMFFIRDTKVDEDLEKQLQSRGISDVSPEAVIQARKEPQPRIVTSPFDIYNEKDPVTKSTTPQIDYEALVKPTFVQPKKRKETQDLRDRTVEFSKRLATEVTDMVAGTGNSITSIWADALKGISNVFEKRKQLGAKPEQGEIIDTLSSDFLNSTPKGYIRDITNEEFEYKKAVDKIDEETDRAWDQIMDSVNTNVPGIATVFKDLKKDVSTLKTKEYYQNRKEWEEADWKTKFSKYLPETIYNYAPSLVASFGVYAINLTAATTIMAGSTADEIRDMALENGASNFDANTYAVSGGVLTAMLERVVPERVLSGASRSKFLNNFTKRFVSKAGKFDKQIAQVAGQAASGLESGALESGTEFSQEALALMIESVFRDDLGYEEAEARLATNTILGGMSGTSLDVMFNVYSDIKEDKIQPSVGLSIEDVSQINRELNEKNTEDFKRDVLMGKREDDRAIGDTFKRLKDNGIFQKNDTPDTVKTVYRASKDDKINPGDPVTTRPELAEKYVKEREGSSVSTANVPIRDLINSLGLNGEFLYAPESYVDTRNEIEKLSEIDKSIFDQLLSKELRKRIEEGKELTLKEELEVADLFIDFESKSMEENDGEARQSLEQDIIDLFQIEEIAKARGDELTMDFDDKIQDYGGEIENNYDNFVDSLRKISRFTKLKKEISEGSLDTYNKIMDEKGLLVEDIFSSSKLSDEDMFVMFKERLINENPELLFSKKYVKENKMEPKKNIEGKEKLSKEQKLLIKKIESDIKAGIHDKVVEGKRFAKGIEDEMTRLIDRSKFLSPKEAKQVATVFERSIKEGTIDPKKILRKESVIMRDRFRREAVTARKTRIFTEKKIKEYQSAAKKIIDESSISVMTKNNRRWFETTIRNLNEQNFNESINKIEDRIQSIINKDSNLAASKEIDSLLKKNTSIRKAGSIPKGNGFSQEVQLAIDTLYKANKMWAEKRSTKGVQEWMNSNIIDITTGAKDYEKKALENYYLNMFLNTDNRASLLREVRSIIDDGSIKKNIDALNTEADYERQINFFEKTIYGGEEKPSFTKMNAKARARDWFKSVKDFDLWIFKSYNACITALNYMNSVETDQKNPFTSLGFFREETKRREMNNNFQVEFKNVIINNYNIGSQKKNKVSEGVRKYSIYRNAMKHLAKEINLGRFTDAFGKDTGELKLTKNTIIKVWQELQNDIKNGNRDILINGNGFTVEMETAIENAMSKKDKDFAIKQFDLYQKYAQIARGDNIDQYGIDFGDLGYTYSTARIENFNIKDEDLYNATMKEQILRGNVKLNIAIERSGGSENKRLAFQDSTVALNKYVKQVIKNHTYYKQYGNVTRVFKNPDIRAAIKYTFGDSFMKTMDKHLDYFATEKREGVVIDWIDKLRSNIIISTLAIKPRQFLKQYSSLFAYANEMSSKDFVDGVTDYYKNKNKNKKKMEDLNSFFKLRGVVMDEALEVALSKEDAGDGHSVFSDAKKEFMFSTRVGDKSPILAGGWALYKVKLRELKKENSGRDHKELEIKAMEYAAKFTDNTQQSLSHQEKSIAQRSGSIAMIPFTYTQSNVGFQRQINHAVRSLFRKDGTKPKNLLRVAKTIFIYHVLLNVMFEAATEFPDFDKDDLKRSALLGNLNKLLVGSKILDSMYDILNGRYVYSDVGIIESKLNLLVKSISSLKVEDITLEDYIESARFLTEFGGSVSGYPTKYAWNVAEGIKRIQIGDKKSGLKLLSGDSTWAVDINNPLVKMMDKSRDEFIELDEARKVIKDARESNQITGKYADELWETFRLAQWNVIMEEKLKEINNLSNTSDQNREYDSLNDEEKSKINSIVASKFNSKRREIKAERDNKRISQEAAEKQWERYNDLYWYPGK